jgi:hypothetical protein
LFSFGRIGVASILVAIVATAGGAGFASAAPDSVGVPAVDAAQQVTTDPSPARAYATPSLAIDPKNTDVMAVSDGEGRSANCRVQVSTTAGLSWSPTSSFTPAQYPTCVYGNLGSIADVTFGPDGTLFVVFGGQRMNDWHQSIFLARSYDLGAHWQTIEMPKQDPDSVHKFSGQSAASSVAVDPNNPKRVYVGWWTNFNLGLSAVPPDVRKNHHTNFPARPMIAVSNDGGQTFADPVDSAGALQAWLTEPHMTVGTHGELYVFYGDQVADDNLGPGGNPDGHLWFAKSTDGGKTYAFPKAIYERTRTNDGDWAWLQGATGGVNPQTGQLYVAFEAVGSQVPVQQPPPNAAPFPTTKIVPPATDPPAAVKFMRSSDGGTTWSQPARVNDVEPASHWGCCTFEPRMSMAPNGRIDVAWYDYRNDTAFNPMADVGSQDRFQDVYYSYSLDGGITWAKNIRITDRSIDRNLGVHSSNYGLAGPIGIASTSNAAMVAWDDTRNSTPETQSQDIYTGRARFVSSTLPIFSTGQRASDRGILWAASGAGGTLVVIGLLFLVIRRRSPT